VRSNPQFSLDDTATIKRLIRENPWATLVSMTSAGLVASHYPVLLDEQREEISVVSHVGRPDEELHELGEHELILIVQGPHGYISSSWFGAAPAVPTWNFIVAHLHGVPEILSADDNLEVLGLLVDHFERRVAQPRLLHRSEADSAFERALSSGTVGFRLTPSRITAKRKMSQNKSAEIFTTVLEQLEGEGPYADSSLAREMRLARTGL
jgi:transcriptional regulator